MLVGTSAWAGLVVHDVSEVGWSSLVDGVLEEVHLAEAVEPLVHPAVAVSDRAFCSVS